MSIIVRKAEANDMNQILIELKKFSKFFDSKYQLFGDDEAYNHNLINSLIQNHLFLVAEKDGEFLGLIAGSVTPHLFNPTLRVLTELFWWVREDRRHSRAGAMLFHEFMKFGKENCQWILMTLEEISPVKKETLLSRGFKLKESAFIMEI